MDGHKSKTHQGHFNFFNQIETIFTFYSLTIKYKYTVSCCLYFGYQLGYQDELSILLFSFFVFLAPAF